MAYRKVRAELDLEYKNKCIIASCNTTIVPAPISLTLQFERLIEGDSATVTIQPWEAKLLAAMLLAAIEATEGL